MYANKPELAKEFEAATPKDAKLPERIRPQRANPALVKALKRIHTRGSNR